jgi:peptide/nickel transport system permease protein
MAELSRGGIHLHHASEGVTQYLARRAGLSLVVVAGVVVLTFVVARVVPGDPAISWAGPHASPSEVADARHHLGLDRPLVVQIETYFRRIVSGNWGTSIHTHRSVLYDLAHRVPASLELVIAALVLALALGIPVGLLAARRQGSAVDHAVRGFAVLGVSMPIFWLALILQLVFFSTLHVLPVAGEFDPRYQAAASSGATGFPIVDALVTGNWSMLGSTLTHLVLPAVAIAAYPAGVVARMVRASVLDVSRETHVQMLRAFGFRERTIFNRFAMRLAWSPVAQVVALVFAYSLVNTFLVESIFDWPGLGSYAADSIIYLDTPAIVGITLFVAIVYVFANLAVDVIQAWLDPRIRLT